MGYDNTRIIGTDVSNANKGGTSEIVDWINENLHLITFDNQNSLLQTQIPQIPTFQKVEQIDEVYRYTNVLNGNINVRADTSIGSSVVGLSLPPKLVPKQVGMFNEYK